MCDDYTCSRSRMAGRGDPALPALPANARFWRLNRFGILVCNLRGVLRGVQVSDNLKQKPNK